MASYTWNTPTIYSVVKSAFGLHQKVTGPPKLPPELELQIFEICALDCPEVCVVLVRVVRRVHLWSVVTIIVQRLPFSREH